MTSAVGEWSLEMPSVAGGEAAGVEDRLDEGLEETFPASDPVSIYVKPRSGRVGPDLPATSSEWGRSSMLR
jgi:hypothetical protein